MNNKVLTFLNLSSNYLTNRGWDMSGILEIAKALESNMMLKNLDLSSNNLVGETAYIKATKVQGDSKEVGAKVTYQGREMTVKGIDSDGELKLADFSGVYALAKALKSNAVLTSLNLSSNNIGNYGAKEIAEALRSGKAVLTSLNLFDNRIGPEGANAIADALGSGSAVLTTLDLSGNQLCGIDPKGEGTYDATGIRAIADALKSGKALTDLDLSGNQLCGIDIRHGGGTYHATGIQALADALGSGSAVLTSLNLSSNRIGKDGAEAIADALRSGKAVLTDLNLRNNNIGKDGAEAIADALRSSKVNNLNLSLNEIGDNGAVAIAAALKSGDTVLTDLNLARNIIGTKGAEAIAEALESGNAVLTSLNLYKNRIDETLLHRIRVHVLRIN